MSNQSAEDLKKYIRDIPDFPKPGIIFKDITPLLYAPEALKSAVDLFIEKYRDEKPDRIIGIESRGFIFATAMSYAMGVGLSLARKEGKLPYKTIKETYDLEYGTSTLELHEDAIEPGERVVIVDDLLATGGTLAATCQLVERLGGDIVGVGVLVELEFLKGRDKIKGQPFHSFMKY